MIFEYQLYNGFKNAYENGEYQKTVDYTLILEKISPYNSKIQITLATLNQGDAQQRINMAKKLSPLDPELLEFDIEYSISQKNRDVFEKCTKYIQMAPMQEKTYYNVKDYLKNAFETGIYTQTEYDSFLSYIDTKRNEVGVVDRNELLNELAN